MATDSLIAMPPSSLEERHRAERVERAIGLARREGDRQGPIRQAHLLAQPEHAQAASPALEVVDPDHRACTERYRTPPSQAQGNAVSTSAIGYQAGPRSIGIVAIAPSVLTTSPRTPRARA